MLDLTQLFVRLVAALTLGAVIGFERELVGKEAGIRTGMLVSGGAALFTIAGLLAPAHIDVSAHSAIANIIANVVVGIGFLGGGIIIKSDGHVRGLTTAATVWTTAAIGILAGLGIYALAILSAIFISGLLFSLRSIRVREIKD